MTNQRKKAIQKKSTPKKSTKRETGKTTKKLGTSRPATTKRTTTARTVVTKKPATKSGTSTAKKPTPKRAAVTGKQQDKLISTSSKAPSSDSKNKKEFPTKFPFWARFKPSKKRTTLVIDETKVIEKKSKKEVDGFVHREATHSYRKDYEIIEPNPDTTDNDPMYLKRPSKKPKRMFEPHNKNLDMPKHLEEKYSKNNSKK